VIVAVAYNIEKQGLFAVEERKDLIRQSVKGNGNVVVDSFEGLLVDYATKMDARFVIRGLRAMSDFEYEFQMASMNRTLNARVDTIFMMTSKDYFFVSSRTIKEVASFHGSIEKYVPEVVAEALKKKFGHP
jgi:pantetheine-phosphate adenylyltransferase